MDEESCTSGVISCALPQGDDYCSKVWKCYKDYFACLYCPLILGCECRTPQIPKACLHTCRDGNFQTTPAASKQLNDPPSTLTIKEELDGQIHLLNQDNGDPQATTEWKEKKKDRMRKRGRKTRECKVEQLYRRV